MRTSSVARLEMVTGLAVWARKAFLSTREPVGVAGEEVVGEDLVEALYIRVLHGVDVVAVEQR